MAYYRGIPTAQWAAATGRSRGSAAQRAAALRAVGGGSRRGPISPGMSKAAFNAIRGGGAGQAAAAQSRTQAAVAKHMNVSKYLHGKRGLAVGMGAAAFGAYELGKNRSTGRNGLQPGSSGGMGY